MILNFTYWCYLPFEIRRIILEILARDESNIFRHLSVCREWQRVTEPTAFRQIRITPSRLPLLSKLAYPRRGSLECIKFCIRLQEYDCPQCKSANLEGWVNVDVENIKAALRKLFHALSTWELDNRPLILDISVSSPSDVKHHFKNRYFNDTDNLAENTYIMDDPNHGWKDGRQVTLPSLTAQLKVFGFFGFDEAFWHELPQVMAITGIQIRRQNRRQIEPRTLQRLLTFLPKLQTICYEPWRQWNRSFQYHADCGYLVLLQSLISARLTKLIIFEDFDDDYVKIQPRLGHPWCEPEPLRTANPRISAALVQASCGLENLSVSFLVDATDFFPVRRPRWTWHNLTSLTPTSRTLVPSGSDYTKVNDLLQDAANFAMHAPKLATLTLWNYDSQNASAFVYQASRTEQWAQITWRATWLAILQPATIKSWEAVALQHTSRELSILTENLNFSAILQSRGDAIKNLRLPAEVIHPRSLSQIMEEAKY